MKQLILSILLISGIAQAATDDGVRSFEVSGGIRYVRGRFDVEREDRTLLTTPTKPTKARSEAVGVYTDRPRSMEESFLIEGEDGRERITETGTFPWSVHGQMTWQFEGMTYAGSGVLVGPHHFLTAAHNVYKHALLQQARNIKVRLGLNDDVATFGEVLGTKVYLYDRWMRFGDQEYDLALVILNQSIGHETGWAGLLCLEDEELKAHRIHVTGYPGDKGLKTMWTMEDTISRVERSKLHYLIDTYKGQSGGSIWIKKWGMPHVLGTHAYAGTLTDGGNFGVRLNEQKIRDVAGWIRDTLVIDKPVAEPVAPPTSAGAGGGASVGAGSTSVTLPVVREVPREPTRPSAGGGAGAGAGSGIGAEVTPSRIRPALRAYPPIAIGHEAEYDLFLSKILTYKPNKDNNIGRVDIPIRSLANPLDHTFDLSRFGDTGKYISIHTGYKKGRIPANANKTEIWFTPKFLVEANLSGDASWMRGIMERWEQPYGIIWTWGGKDASSDNFDYLVSGEVVLDESKNLDEKFYTIPLVKDHHRGGLWAKQCLFFFK